MRTSRLSPGSLSARVFALLLIAILIPLVVAFAQTRQDLHAAEERAIADARAAASMAAEQVADAIGDATASATTIGRMPGFWSGDDADRDQILAALAGPRLTFNGLAFYGDDLRQHGSSNPAPRAARRELSARAYGREALSTGRTAFTNEPVLATADGKALLPIALPIVEQGPAARRGLVIATLSIERLPTIWSLASLPEGSRLLLVDVRNGRVLGTDRGLAANPSATLQATTLARVRQGDRSFTTTSADGLERSTSWAPVAGTPWIVVVGIPAGAVLGPIQRAAAFRDATSLAVAVVTAGLLLLLGRRLARRLHLVHRAAEHWAREEWGHRTGAAADDELGRLAGALDRMADQLDTTSRELAARNVERDLAERRRASLLRVAHALAEQDDGERIADTIEREAIAALGADVALIALWDADRGGLWSTRKPAAPVESWRATLATPMLHDGGLLGTISVGHLAEDGRFSPEDAEYMELLAGLGAAHLVGHQRTRLAGVVLAGRTAQHELNNRLARVVGYAELLSLTPGLADDGARMAQLVLDGAVDASDIVKRMGGVSRLEEVDWGGAIGRTIDLERSLGR